MPSYEGKNSNFHQKISPILHNKITLEGSKGQNGAKKNPMNNC